MTDDLTAAVIADLEARDGPLPAVLDAVEPVKASPTDPWAHLPWPSSEHWALCKTAQYIEQWTDAGLEWRAYTYTGGSTRIVRRSEWGDLGVLPGHIYVPKLAVLAAEVAPHALALCPKGHWHAAMLRWRARIACEPKLAAAISTVVTLMWNTEPFAQTKAALYGLLEGGRDGGD